MNSDERVRRAFENLRRQADQIDLSEDTGDPRRLTSTRVEHRRSLLSAIAAAVVMVVGVGAVLFLQGGDVEPTSAGTDSTVVALTAPSREPAPPVLIYSSPDDQATTDTTPSIVSATTSSLPTDPLSGVLVDGGAGWRVIGVASDDALNVRSGGGVEYEIVGALAHDDVDVVLSGWGATQLDGTGWWGVQLTDGTEGFVNRRFLAPPAAWFVGSSGCAASQAAVSPAESVSRVPDQKSNASGILGLAHEVYEHCERFVVALGSGPAYDAGVEADLVPGGVKVSATPGEIVIDFADTKVRNVASTATNDVFGPTLAITSVPGGSSTSLAPSVHFFTAGIRRIEGIAFLDHPARIIITVAGDDQIDASVITADSGFTVVVESVETGNGAIIRGFARWFEAQGMVRLFNSGGSPWPATWFGDSITNPGLGEATGVYAPWSPTWGEFEFTVSKMPPGSYTMFVGESCLIDEANDVWEDCGVTVEFTVR